MNDANVNISPPCLNWKSKTLHGDFKAFKAHCNHIFQGLSAETDQAAKINYLILWMGNTAEHVVLKTPQSSDEYMVDTYFDLLEKYIRPVGNFRMSRYQFYQPKQWSDEPTDIYNLCLKDIIRQCSFPDEI